jgi:hypothetical protein
MSMLSAEALSAMAGGPFISMQAAQGGMTQTPQGGMMQAPQGGMSQAPQGGMMGAPQPGMMQAPQGQMMQGGHLYMQTNEVRNCIIHYFRAPDGKISEMERVLTGGAGSGTYKPISDTENTPNAFEGANSVIITPDRRFLFTTNGGDNSVSSFAVSVDGKLALLDAKRTGNVVAGRSGTAKALAYSYSHGTRCTRSAPTTCG